MLIFADPGAEVVFLSPKTLMESDRYVCEICNQGFQRDQNLQMHRRRHKVCFISAFRCTFSLFSNEAVHFDLLGYDSDIWWCSIRSRGNSWKNPVWELTSVSTFVLRGRAFITTRPMLLATLLASRNTIEGNTAPKNSGNVTDAPSDMQSSLISKLTWRPVALEAIAATAVASSPGIPYPCLDVTRAMPATWIPEHRLRCFSS